VLARMPLRYQQCVILKDYGYKQKQIAAMLGISEAAVSEILRDVKTELKRKYFPVRSHCTLSNKLNV
jgi:DNA-directed RNA polymerase specialized sigma24 family protein